MASSAPAERVAFFNEEKAEICAVRGPGELLDISGEVGELPRLAFFQVVKKDLSLAGGGGGVHVET